jgi:CHAT domain
MGAWTRGASAATCLGLFPLSILGPQFATDYSLRQWWDGIEENDGYLSASEITNLELDADWVILSACNTTAGGAEGAEALSSLARTFFYAGARALLVSHWAVASDATVKFITGAVQRMASDKRIGRAEVMRQSMLALIYRGEAYEAHPAFWAPCMVVGEGQQRGKGKFRYRQAEAESSFACRFRRLWVKSAIDRLSAAEVKLPLADTPRVRSRRPTSASTSRRAGFGQGYRMMRLVTVLR